jgi:hypothetical protein
MSAIEVWEGLFTVLLKEFERPIPPPSLSDYRSSNASSDQGELLVCQKENFENLHIILSSLHSQSTQFSIAASGEADLEDYQPMAMMLLESLTNLLAVFQSTGK